MALRGQLGRAASAQAVPTPVEAAWVRAQIDRLAELLERDPARAKMEVARHLGGPSS
jgi:hypothetical protein